MLYPAELLGQKVLPLIHDPTRKKRRPGISLTSRTCLKQLDRHHNGKTLGLGGGFEPPTSRSPLTSECSTVELPAS